MENKIDNISLKDALKQLETHKTKILAEFATAYLAETGLNPSEVELVQVQTTTDKEVTTVLSFRKKGSE
jgi:hypothetical protein